MSEATDSNGFPSSPSWAVVATGDKAGTDVFRSMAEQAGTTITQVEGSAGIMVPRPQAVTDVILDTVAGVGSTPAETGGAT